MGDGVYQKPAGSLPACWHLYSNKGCDVSVACVWPGHTKLNISLSYDPVMSQTHTHKFITSHPRASGAHLETSVTACVLT
jgi:hypothetical protein